MFTKLFSVIGMCASVLTLAVVSSPATVSVSTSAAKVPVVATAPSLAEVPPATSLRVLPFEGTYLGVDAHHRTVRFVYRHGRITHFRVNQTLFPDASVQGHQWHHTCAHSLCTRGHWTTDVVVEGKWNDARQGGDVHFTANLIAH